MTFRMGRSFALGQRDYIVDGQPFLDILFEYGETNTETCFYPLNHYPRVRERLIGQSEPNYVLGRHALYHCTHCGGDDGDGLSANILISNDYVIWCNFGWGSDLEEHFIRPFPISPTFRFSRDSYMHAFKTFTPTPKKLVS